MAGIAAQIDLIGDGHGHHIPGTIDVYKHGWVPITPTDWREADFKERAKVARRMRGGYAVKLPLDPEPALAVWPLNLRNHEEFQAVADWTWTSACDVINTALRTRTMPPHPRDREVQVLDRIMSRYTLQRESTVYRGMAVTPKWAERLKPGAEFSDLGYTAVTTDRKKAASWARGRAKGKGGTPAVIEVTLPPGTHMMPGTPKLAEYTLHRESRYRVNSVSADGTVYKITMLQ